MVAAAAPQVSVPVRTGTNIYGVHELLVTWSRPER